MAHLTNGTVSYERRVKTGDFEHKHAAVTINYALDENDDADQLLARASSLVVRHVHQTIYAKPDNGSAFEKAHAFIAKPEGSSHIPSFVPSVAPSDPVFVDEVKIETDDEREDDRSPVVFVDPLPTQPTVTNLKAAKRAAKVKRFVPPVDQVASVASDGVSDLFTDEPTTEAVVENPTVAASLSPGMDTAAENFPVVTEKNGLPIVVEDFVAAAPPASDGELGQALSRVNAKLKDRLKIMSLIGEFVLPGQSYTTIPDARRGEFLSRLEALA